MQQTNSLNPLSPELALHSAVCADNLDYTRIIGHTSPNCEIILELQFALCQLPVREDDDMWMVYAVAASALWGLEYALLGRLFAGRLSPLSLLAIQMTVGTVLIGSIALATAFSTSARR